MEHKHVRIVFDGGIFSIPVFQYAFVGVVIQRSVIWVLVYTSGKAQHFCDIESNGHLSLTAGLEFM
jgi:hypothetical protein